MIKPDCIIRTNRRSISISISKEGLIIVRAPKSLPMEKILNFVNEKKGWINKHLDQLNQSNMNNFDIKNYSSMLVLGKKYNIKKIDGIKKLEFCTEEVLCPMKWEKQFLITKIHKFYKELAKQILVKRIEYFANIMQLNYNSFTIKNYKARWGCCSKKGDIIINYKTIMLPHLAIDYILIHELSHLIEFNHSTKFYKIIESVMPEYKKNRKLLKTYNFLLNI